MEALSNLREHIFNYEKVKYEMPKKIRISVHDSYAIFSGLLASGALTYQGSKRTYNGIPVEVDTNLLKGQIEFN